jgi:hypothetical protein
MPPRSGPAAGSAALRKPHAPRRQPFRASILWQNFQGLIPQAGCGQEISACLIHRGTGRAPIPRRESQRPPDVEIAGNEQGTELRYGKPRAVRHRLADLRPRGSAFADSFAQGRTAGQRLQMRLGPRPRLGIKHAESPAGLSRSRSAYPGGHGHDCHRRGCRLPAPLSPRSSIEHPRPLPSSMLSHLRPFSGPAGSLSVPSFGNQR